MDHDIEGLKEVTPRVLVHIISGYLYLKRRRPDVIYMGRTSKARGSLKMEILCFSSQKWLQGDNICARTSCEWSEICSEISRQTHHVTR